MQLNKYATPLLQPDSPLDERSRHLIQDMYDKETQKAANLPTDDPLDPKRRKRVDFTKEEIWEQPDILHKNLELEISNIKEIAAYIATRNIERIYMMGCGDSIASLLAVRHLYENLLGIPCEAIQALDFTYYYYKPVNERTLVITLSSSGATTRTVEAMLIARAYGAVTLTLSNTEGSPLMVESKRGILIHAERKGWPTQSSTAAMALLYLLGLQLSPYFGFEEKAKELLMKELYELPGQVQSVLEQTNEKVLEIAKIERDKGIYLFCGGGPAYASALIGAAKIKECTPDHAISIPLEEFHHYNSQKVDDPLFLIAPQGPSVPRAQDTAKEGKRWGGKVYSIVTKGDDTLTPHSDIVLQLPKIEEYYTPILYTIPVQLFAYHLAMEKFRFAERNRDR